MNSPIATCCVALFLVPFFVVGFALLGSGMDDYAKGSPL